MTLWHLLHSVSFVTPLMSALFVGIKTGNHSGIIASIVIGLGLALASFYCLYIAGYHVNQRYEKAKSKTSQNFFISILYLGPVIWSFLASVTTNCLTGLVVSYLIVR